jgi:His-Xaa-Ser repeat protein HxsA
MPKPVTSFPAAVRGDVGMEAAPPMSRSEKLHLQVFRVQIKLNTLGLYQGQITGKLDDETKRALRMFQSVKGLRENGLMSTETLNALGISAVK